MVVPIRAAIVEDEGFQVGCLAQESLHCLNVELSVPKQQFLESRELKWSNFFGRHKSKGTAVAPGIVSVAPGYSHLQVLKIGRTVK